jgi:hypothetical protein
MDETWTLYVINAGTLDGVYSYESAVAAYELRDRLNAIAEDLHKLGVARVEEPRHDQGDEDG